MILPFNSGLAIDGGCTTSVSATSQINMVIKRLWIPHDVAPHFEIDDFRESGFSCKVTTYGMIKATIFDGSREFYPQFPIKVAKIATPITIIIRNISASPQKFWAHLEGEEIKNPRLNACPICKRIWFHQKDCPIWKKAVEERIKTREITAQNKCYQCGENKGEAFFVLCEKCITETETER